MPSCSCSPSQSLGSCTRGLDHDRWGMEGDGLGRGVAHLIMVIGMVTAQYGTAVGEHTIALISSRMVYKERDALDLPAEPEQDPPARPDKGKGEVDGEEEGGSTDEASDYDPGEAEGVRLL